MTSITTSVAFFASAGFKVPSIALFSTYCGLVVAAVYLLCILMVFPALCIYDKHLMNGSESRWYRFSFDAFRKSKRERSEVSGTMPSKESRRGTACTMPCEESMRGTECSYDSKSVWINSNFFGRRNRERREFNSIMPHEASRGDADCNNDREKGWWHRVLSLHYRVLHRFRCPLLLLSMGAIGICAYIAMVFPPPDEPDPSFLPQSNRYEVHRVWSRRLLMSQMAKGGQGEVFFIWGLNPADTGFHLDPYDDSELVFDSKFDPRPEESQSYLLGWCDKIFGGEGKVLKKLSCPMEGKAGKTHSCLSAWK